MIEAAEPPGTKRPIAILVDRDGLGDTILRMPLLRAVARANPEHPIWWIASHDSVMAHQMAPMTRDLIAKVIEYAGTKGKTRDVVKRLKEFPPFELVFDTRSRIATVILARMFLAYREFYCLLPGYALSTRRPPGHWLRPEGVGARMLSLAEAATRGKADWQARFAICEQARTVAAERLPEGPRYIGIATGSRDARKNWPLDRFIELARTLSAEGATPVFFTGPEERELIERLRSDVPGALFPQAETVDPVITPIEFAIAVGERMRAAVANDSGIGHVLGALQIPLVSLFGFTNPARWAPFNSNGMVIRAQDHGSENLDAIPVEAVLQALRRVLR
jgi:ADP-heptose:LPS heptosyltransferase